MRRWLARTLICLIVGAITTVAVAWGCAAFSDYDRERREFIEPVLVSIFEQPWLVSIETEYGFGRRASGIGALLRRVAPDEAADAPVEWSETWLNASPVTHGPMPLRQAPAPSFLGDRAPDLLIEYQESCGWPTLALWCSTSEVRLQDGHSQTIEQTSSAIRFPLWLNATSPAYYERQLPLRIIPWGFAIDAIFYAVVWFGLIVGIGTSRRALRRRRGRCPMCAYDLRGCPAGSRASPAGCPECGWNRSDGQPPGGAGG